MRLQRSPLAPHLVLLLLYLCPVLQQYGGAVLPGGHLCQPKGSWFGWLNGLSTVTPASHAGGHRSNASGLNAQPGAKNLSPAETNDLSRQGPYLRVCIIGRPNVGKSALFNRICMGNPQGGSQGGALVSEVAGTTRDSLLGSAEWRGKALELADTGGLLSDDADLGPLASQLREQVAFALQQAACVVLVVDARIEDEYMAEMARRLKVPVVLCVNKCENPKTALTQAQAFWRLGLGQPVPCSAITGTGVAEVLDRCLESSPSLSATSAHPSLRTQLYAGGNTEKCTKVAVIGRPNAGKSRLLNSLLNAQRSIVSPLPGTTRDAVDEFIKRGDSLYCLVDTAGIRRASVVRRSSVTDLQSVTRAKAAARRADVCLLVIDGKAGLTQQDVNLAKTLEAYGRAVVIVINKWDVALQTEDFKHSEAVDYVHRVLYPLAWAEVLFVSAETGQGISKIWPAIDAAAKQHQRRLTTGLLNFVVRDAVAMFPPPLTKDGKRGKIYLAQQVATQPPTMVVFCNKGEFFREAYRRYLDFSVRSAFNFRLTPIRWIFRDKRLRSTEQLVRQKGSDLRQMRHQRKPSV